MKIVIVTLSIAAYVSVVYCAVAILPPVEKPKEMADQEGCYIPEFKKVLPYDSPYSPRDGKRCVQYTCRKDNVTTIFSCGKVGIGKGCAIIPGDKSLPYPDCCDKPACNSINHKSIAT